MMQQGQLHVVSLQVKKGGGERRRRPKHFDQTKRGAE